MATPDTLYETLSGPNIVDGITNAKSAWFFFWLGILLLLSGPILNDRFHINLNIIDLFLCLFLMYTILNSLVHNLVFFSRKNIEGVGLLIFYFLVKILFSGKDLSERWYEFSVLFLTFIHVVVAILQWFELIPSFNSYFKIMGFFHNPGPFAIYLATLFVFCLTVFLYSNNSAIKITALVLFLLCIPILVVTISRAAWLGALVGMSFVIETKYRVWATHIKSLRAVTKNLFSIVVIAGVLLVSYQLYLLKENSANGRLLIWKITGVVVKDHCLVGVGLGNFPASFLEYQSLYFQQHPDRVSEEGQLAGETWYAFNDILQITAEQGIIGFGLIGALLFSIVKASIGLLKKNLKKTGKDKNLLIIASMAMLLVILLSGLFSYPLTLLVFKILFCVIIAILSSNSDKLNNTEIYVTKQMWGIGKVVVIIICIVIGLSFISYGMKLYQGYKQWHSSETEPSQYIETDDLVTTFPFLIEDPKFVVLQGYNLIAKQKFDEAVTLLESAKSFCPNKSLYYALGLAYKYSNKTDKAEEQYKFLEYAMPTLIRPKYMLAKLYYETKQTTEWRNKALEIINFKPKIQSRYTEAMIQEIRELYYND